MRNFLPFWATTTRNTGTNDTSVMKCYETNEVVHYLGRSIIKKDFKMEFDLYPKTHKSSPVIQALDPGEVLISVEI